MEKLVKSTDLSRYFNSTQVFAFGWDIIIIIIRLSWSPSWTVHKPHVVLLCRDGSLVAHFWLILSVPSSQRDDVSVQRVNESLYRELQRFTDTQQQHICTYEGFQILLSSLSLTGNIHHLLICLTFTKLHLFFNVLCCCFTFQKPAPKLLSFFKLHLVWKHDDFLSFVN